MNAPKRQRVLITGAAGFIGQACAREFLRRQWQVFAMAHRQSPQGLDGATIVRGSITDPQELKSTVDSIGPLDAIVNCAGRATDVGPQSRFRRANYEGVLNLIECMSPQGVGRLVHVSTTDVYGLRDFQQADEATPFCDNPRNPYPRYKIAAEIAIRGALPPERYAILRPGAVWGPGDRAILPRVLSILRRSHRIMCFGRWRGRNRWPLAHVRTVAVAAFLAASRDECLGQAYNVLDPQHISFHEYNLKVIRTFLSDHSGMKMLCLPFAAGWVAGLAGTVLSNLLRVDTPVMDPTLYGLYCISRNLDFSSGKLERLFKLCGESFVDHERGFEELAQQPVHSQSP